MPDTFTFHSQKKAMMASILGFSSLLFVILGSAHLSIHLCENVSHFEFESASAIWRLLIPAGTAIG